MNNRIHQLFDRKKENILSIYITAGFPKLEDTIDIIKRLDESGVDMIEIGFPFSDPLADGPVIQESSQKAISNGMTLKVLFEQLKGIRNSTHLPLVLMGYFNPVMQFGESNFIEECSKIGIDGIIIPDMPLSYYQLNLQEMCRKKNISNILLITPQTSDERIVEIDENSEGFIYMVSSNSVTGANKTSISHSYFERIGNMSLRNPTLTGFGIHDKTSFDMACNYSSGAIIGSAFIRHIEINGISENSIQQFIKNIRS